MLDLMATPTEQIAIWILEAIKAESEREPDWLKCRTEATVLGEVMAERAVTTSDINRGIRFLLDIHCIQGLNRPDGRALAPTSEGLQHLSAHRASEAATKKNRLSADRT